MKVSFTNKKDRKNCQYFSKALREIEKKKITDSERNIYLSVSKEQLRITSSLDDIHRKIT